MNRSLATLSGIVLLSGSLAIAAPGRMTGPDPVKAMRIAAERAAEPQLYLYSASIQPEDDNAAQALKTKNIRIINLGPVINSSSTDYAPTVTADGKTLFFVSNRKGSKADKKQVEYRYDASDDFWAATKEERLDTVFKVAPFNIEPDPPNSKNGVNTIYNEGAASISADGQRLIFTACDRADGFGSCDLYETTIDGIKWGKPSNLGKNVNSEFWDSQPSLSPDGNRIYFASNRLGPNNTDKDISNENYDIWYTDFDEETGEWKPAKNLGAVVNTAGQELSPFIAKDGVTLYFASSGHLPNQGYKDFYYCTLTDPEKNVWSKPQPIPYPGINTPKDEEFISFPASGDVIYFSSDRNDLAGYQGDLDIFMAFVPPLSRAVIVRAFVNDECTGEAIPATITIKNMLTGTVKKDSVTMTRKEFQYVVQNSDYGSSKDPAKSVQFEVTASNPNYGERKEVVTVSKPETTYDKDKANASVELPPLNILLGKKPEIAAEMEYADYIKRVAKKNPSLASWKGLVLEEVATIDLFPLLPYVFFDSSSSTIPGRYRLYKSPTETAAFSDERVVGDKNAKTPEKYYDILNIYGYRLRKYPSVKVKVTGCNDDISPGEKSLDLSQRRAQIVYDYLKNIWQIPEDRLTLDKRGLPDKLVASQTGDRDPQSKLFSNIENRRTELSFTGDPEEVWNVMKPLIDRDPTIFPSPLSMNFIMKNGIEEELVASRRIEVSRNGQEWNTLNEVGTKEPSYTWNWKDKSGRPLPESVTDENAFKARLVVKSKNGSECASDPITINVKIVKNKPGLKVEKAGAKTRETYKLVLFPFNRYDAGPFNERIMREFVYTRTKPNSDIVVEGHTDVVGMYEANSKLSTNRAKTVETGIRGATKSQVQSLESKGVGEDEPFYINEIPEGRLYNRTVQINIQTPIEED
jgi:outer membrane protein OmpA-like peptidoglycan-associated protein